MKISRLLRSKINKRRKAIHLFWWRPGGKGRRNFGDEITGDIVRTLWGRRCLWTRVADCDMIGAGSILEIANEHARSNTTVKVWGSGCMARETELTNPSLEYHAVRGPYTREKLAPRYQNIPLGDPGLLANLVYPRSKTQGSIGIVPHFRHFADLEKQLEDRPGVLLINPLQTPSKVIADITKCSLVFSSSLHGLIVADSYGIPNVRMKLADLEGVDFKFADYYASTERPMIQRSWDECLSILKNGEAIDAMIQAYEQIARLEDMQRGLIDAFPYDKETS